MSQWLHDWASRLKRLGVILLALAIVCAPCTVGGLVYVVSALFSAPSPCVAGFIAGLVTLFIVMTFDLAGEIMDWLLAGRRRRARRARRQAGHHAVADDKAEKGET